MKYDLATNFDNELIHRIAEFGIIESVYGKLSEDIVGGGRQSMILPDISWKELEKHVNVCHGYRIKFNYLLNASCMDNRELIGPSHRKIMDFVGKVRDAGADGVTVSNTTMLKMVKAQFPELKVCTSVYMKPVTVNEVVEFEQEGADEITLYHNFTRNF